MAENKGWRDYLKSVSTEKETDSKETGTWRDLLSGKATESEQTSGGWRDKLKSATTGVVANEVSNRVNSWLQNYNGYISDYQKRNSGRKYSYEDSYVSDSREWLEKAKKQKSAYDTEADEILSYIDQYKDYLDADWVTEIKSTLTGARSNQNKILEAYKKDNEWWNSFGSEDLVKEYGSAEDAYKYYQMDDNLRKTYTGMSSTELSDILNNMEDGKEKDWLTDYKSTVVYDERSKADLDAMAKEIEDMENLYNEAFTVGFWHNEYEAGLTPYDRKRMETYNRLHDEYGGDIHNLEKAISQKKQEMTLAGRVQEGIKLSGVADETSEYYDPEFASKTGYVSTESDKWYGRLTSQFGMGYEDLTYEYINGSENGMREDILHKAVVNDYDPDDYYIYDHMTEAQKDLYNYYYNEGGKESAERYLDSIHDALVYQEAQERFGTKKGKTGLELLYGFDAGVDQFQSGFKNFFNTDDAYIPASTTQVVSGMIREDLGNNSGAFSQGAYDLITTTANMAPSILVSTAIGALNPMAGAAAGNALMGVSAAGNAYSDAINRGFDKNQARTYSTLIGVSEVALGAALGGISKLGGISSNLTKAVAGIDSGLARWAIQYGGKIASESLEEGLQEILDPLFQNAILHADENVDWSEVAYSALLGGLSAGALESIGTVKQVGTEQRLKKAYDGKTDSIINEGLASDIDTESYQLATEYKEKTSSGKTLTGAEIRNLLEANQEQITPKDLKLIKSATEKRLTELGETGNVAQIAELATKRATGQKLSKAETSILAHSQYGAQVAKELLPENIEANNAAKEWAKANNGEEVDDSSNWAENIGTRKVNFEAYNKDKIKAREALNEMVRKATEDPNAYKPLESRVEAENDVQVSDTGKSVIRGTDQEIDLSNPTFKEISENGAVLIADGKTVDANNIDYADADLGYAIKAVGKIENITPAAAGAMVGLVDKAKPVVAQMNGLDEAFNYGFYNYSEADLKAGNFTGNLSQVQLNDAYKLGQYVRSQTDMDADAPVVKMRTAAEAKLTEEQKLAQQKAQIESDDVEVYFEDGGKAVKFDEHSGKYDKKRMAAVNTAKFLAKLKIGGKYYFFESYVNEDGDRVYKDADGNEVEAPNGIYKDSDGSIHIDLNAGNDGSGIAMYTLGHELTHFVKAQSKKQFKILADLVTEAFDKTDLSMRERVLEKQKFLEDKRGEKVSYDEAYEEVVADAMSTMLTDGTFHEKLMEIRVKDKGLFNTIKRFFDKMIAKFRKEYAQLTPDQKAAQDIRAMKDMFDKIQTAFAEALVEASDNFQATSGQKNTTKDGGVKNEIREIGNTGRFYVQADRQVLTGDDPELWGKQIENYINERIRNEKDVAIPTADGHILLLTGRSAYKLKDNHIASVQKKVEAILTDEDYALKGRMATHIDELIQVARFDGYESDLDNKHENDIGEDGFNYFEAYFRDFDTKYYRVVFSAALNEQEETVYSIGRIRQRSFPADRGSSSKKEALKNGRKASGSIIYTSEAKSQEVKTALQLAYEKALKQKGDNTEASEETSAMNEVGMEFDADTESVSPKVMNSERGEGSSNRSLLANAFEGITQNSVEYKMLQDYKVHIKELNKLDAKLSDLNAEIRKIRFGTEGARDMARLTELENEAKEVAKEINRYDKRLLSLEASEPLRKVIDRERKKENQKVREHINEIQQNKKMRAEQTELRHKIRKTVRDLDKLLNRGNKKLNVKEDMKGFASKALELADYLFTDHISNDELIRNGITVRMTPKEAALVKETEEILTKLYDQADSLTDEEFKRLDEKRKANEYKMRDLLTAQRNERLNTPVYNLFNDLVTEYAKLKNSGQEAVKAAYNADVERFLRSYIGEDGGETDSDRKTLLQNMRVADMTTDELWKLSNAYEMVLHSIRQANNLFVKGKSETLEQKVGRIANDFESRKIPEGKVATIARNLSNKMGWDYEKLYYALDRIGSEAFTELVMNIADSENTVMQDVMEAAAFRDEMVKKYDYNNWNVNKEIDREFLDSTGKKFKLTLGQLMALYAYSRRDGAWDHIEYGGFVFGEAALTNPRPADSYKLSKDQCTAITDLLTKEQKGYAEDMQKFLSETMGEKGNEVSMLLYGIKMFGEKNYFPIHIAGQFKAQAQESQAKAAAGFSSMTNAGFTHAQNPNAKAPFVLEGFNEIWVDHVNEMSRYHGTVPALEDMRRVMNYSHYSEATAESMALKQMMENSFGKDAVDYFDNLYREANSGAITDKLQKKSKRLLSMFRKNSVAYSLSVLIQQPASMTRAYALVDKKYFGFKGVGALTSGIAKAVSSKWNPAYANAYNEMLKYAPGVTMAKEIGGFDTATGGSIRSYLLDTNKSLKQTMKTGNTKEIIGGLAGVVDDNAIANLPSVADKIAWIEIWNACKRETVAKHKDLATNSEEFMKLVGERFTEVIRATQVYDSIFAKSPMLKSKNLAVQYLVSFMNEPNTVANMVEKAVRDTAKGNWKGGARTAAVVMHSIIFTNVLKSIVYAMRDDDEDETYIEKYLEAVAGNIISDFNPLNYIPIARDVWSLAQGYDVERADMAIAADAIDALTKVVKNATAETDGMTEEQLIAFDKKVTDANWKLVESMAAFFGIPVKNIRREIEGVLNTAKNTAANHGLTTKKSAWDKVYDSVVDSIPFMSTQSKPDKLYDVIISGDKTYLDRLKATYKDEDAYHTAVRKALRENDPRIREAAQAQINGNPSERVRISKLIIADGFIQDDVVMAINAEINAMTPDDSSSSAKKAKGFYTVEDFVIEVANGDRTAANAIKDDVIQTAQKNGKTLEEAEKDFISDVKSNMKKAYLAGSLNDAVAEKILLEYTDMDAEEAAAKVSYWDFSKSNPDYDLNESQVNKFHEFAEPAEIPLDVFVQYLNGTNGLETKYDEWGDEVESKRDQVLAVIDSLDLTWEQKDALYLAHGYAESKIWDVPW